MKLEELEDRVKIEWSGYGTYKVTIKYKNKEYSCHTHNTLATDKIKDGRYEEPKTKGEFYTLKQAYLALYNECKEKNGINIW